MAAPRKWAKLDNVAKLFPPTQTKRDTKVFRFSCELHEQVDPDVLRLALERTFPRFPMYQSVIKTGLFWYYMEEGAFQPVVREEYKPPLTQLYNGNRKGALFEVTYYKRRINFEVFHALADGAGAIQFFRLLVGHYIVEKYETEARALVIQIDTDASREQRRGDSFLKYYEKTSPFPKGERRRAYQLRGEYLSHRRLRVIEGMMPVDSLSQKAKEYSATITEFLTANFMLAIRDQMGLQDLKKPVVISVPVDLRQFFPSTTARNFFGVIQVAYHFGTGSQELTAVLETVKESFHQQLTHENMKQRMNRYAALEHMMVTRLIPLPLKDHIIRIGNWWGKQEVTASFSNVGRIDLPQPLAKHVYMMSVFDSTDKMQAVVNSFQNHFVTSFTSAFVSAEMEMRYFRRLTDLGLEVTISSNPLE